LAAALFTFSAAADIAASPKAFPSIDIPIETYMDNFHAYRSLTSDQAHDFFPKDFLNNGLSRVREDGNVHDAISEAPA
jgi:hypothetical protein